MILTFLRSIPLLTACSVIAYSYWCYIFIFCAKASDDENDLKLMTLFFYHLAIFMMVWSFFQVAKTSPVEIPKKFYLSNSTLQKVWQAKSNNDDIDQILRPKRNNLFIRTYGPGGRIRYCKECKLVKPDRTHHCRSCVGCIPKMDHHCPWMNNCVSFSNYKYFIQFLAYGVLYCFYVAVTMLYTVVEFWADFLSDREVEETVRYHCTVLFVASCFFFMAFTILLMYHIYLVAHNRTTLEAYRAPLFKYGQDRHGFDLGTRKNFHQVFGSDKRLWMVPIFSSLGNGWYFPTKGNEEWGSLNSSEEDDD